MKKTLREEIEILLAGSVFPENGDMFRVSTKRHAVDQIEQLINKHIAECIGEHVHTFIKGNDFHGLTSGGGYTIFCETCGETKEIWTAR